MSISSSMSSALSGLNATRRAADLVSSNVANALTEGYGRRTLSLSSAALGGVRVDGVLRQVDEKLLGDRRLAGAALGEAQTRASALAEIAALFGEPDQAGSLTQGHARFEAALIEAASRPDIPARLDAAARAGTALASTFAQISDGLQTMRMEADRAIARQVESLNGALRKIAALNAQIFTTGHGGQETAALEDQRQRLVDQVAEIVPVRQLAREGGKIALYTPGGGLLLDGTPAEFGFTAANTITPDMSQASGALSGLTLNGAPIRTGGAQSPIAGGTLSGLFATRDEIAVEAQAGLDMLARDLVERFQDPALDPTLGPADPGLFTDGGGAFAAGNDPGLSARLEFNRLASPDAGGESRRLRDGLGAAAAGPAGNASLLQALTGRLTESRAATSAAATGLSRGAGGHAADLLSALASRRQSEEVDLGYQSARFDTLRAAELAGGVDTDAELQQLLIVEQAYAANARVIQTLSTLIDQLMEL